ncbi:MAG: hypothetical protein U0992_18045 [Planctomycetaceae bacterium]
MTCSTLESLLIDVAGGRVAVHAAVAEIQATVPRTALTPDASIDLDRARRCGYPEVVFAQGNPA